MTLYFAPEIAPGQNLEEVPAEVIEASGNTQFRIRSSNLPAPLQMLWCALRTMRDRGAEFVPGSDQHGFMAGIGRIGGAVPADCFHALGIGAADIAFLGRIGRGR